MVHNVVTSNRRPFLSPDFPGPMPSPQRSRRRFGWRARLLLMAGATVFALLTGELLIRVTGLAPEVKPLWLSRENADDLVYKRSQNPILGFELKAGYRNDNADLSVSLPSTNAHGQRDIERTLEKPEGHRRILMLGDSVVEGHGLAKMDDTLSQQLEQLYPDGTTEVLNFGVSGYCTRAEVELLEVKGLSFDPDIVLLVFTENDFQNFNPEALQVDAVVDRPEFVKQLFLSSELFRVCCIQFNWFEFGVQADPVGWNQQAIGDNNVTQGLRRLAELQSEYGFDSLIAVWPRFGEDEITDLHFMPDSDDLIIERLGRVFGFPVIRLSEEFRQLPADDTPPASLRLRFTTGDGLHPGPAGNRAAAGFLQAAVSRLQSGELDAARQAMSAEQQLAELTAIESALQQNEVAAGASTAAYAVQYNNTGQQLEQQGKFEEAREHYEKALEADPTYAEAMCNLGSLALRDNAPAEAMRQYSAALQINPNLAPAHLGVGLLHAQANRAKQAVASFSEALRIDPQSAKAHFNLGALHANQGNPAAAIRHFEDTVRIDPAAINAWFHLGNLKLGTGDHAAAETCYENVLSREPQHVPALTNSGILLVQQQQLAAARERFLQALQIDPAAPGVREYLASVEQQLAAGQPESPSTE